MPDSLSSGCVKQPQLPIKIVFVITGLAVGGAETMLLKLLSEIDRERFVPHVFSLSTLGEIGPRIQALGIPVEALGMRPGSLPSPKVFYRLVRRLRQLKPDVLHTWLYHADLLGGLAARCASVPNVVWCIRNSNLDKDKTRFATRMVVTLCARLSRWIPDRILNCSENARQIHADLGYARQKMIVIPNGFDLAAFKPDPMARNTIRSELGLADNEPLVGLIGRYDPQKNHAGFCQAASLLRGQFPSVHFVMAGPGIDSGNTELVRTLRGHGIDHVTHLLGLRNDMPRLMAALDVLASPSHGEAFSNVLGEAMACGVPCAVTDVGDSAYIVGDTGRVVLAGDMAGMAQALYELLTLSDRERTTLAKRARSRVEQYFEIGNVIRRYEEQYESLSCQSGSPCSC